MIYAVKVESGAMIHVPSFINTGSGVQVLIWEDSHTDRRHTHTHTDTHRMVIS
jgi:hypothetical protein